MVRDVENFLSVVENEAMCRQKCKNGNEKMYANGTKEMEMQREREGDQQLLGIPRSRL